MIAIVVLSLTGCGSAGRARSAVNVPQEPQLGTAATTGCRPQEECALYSRIADSSAAFDDYVNQLWPKLDRQARREFAHGERAWEEYVDQECRVQSRKLKGTKAYFARLKCQLTLTKERVLDVRATLAPYRQGR